MQIIKSSIDMSLLIGELVDIFRPEANIKKVDISTEIPNGLFIKADRNLMRELFNNLISNAIKFSKKSGGEVKIMAKIIEDDIAQFKVCDEGIGIALEDLPHIFERFYQPKVEIPGREKGLGMGLAFVNQIITAHGGMIKAESKMGKGTEITFTLPEASLKKEDRREAITL
ncbi:MAG: HAMP domain-containing sensor histidine kinase [bacterium]